MRAVLLSMSALAASVIWTAPAAAQTQAPTIQTRVDRLEKEMRAVQRKVFPGGALIEPEITRPPAPAVQPGTPASTPVADLIARVDALESQLASMTGQIEQNAIRTRQLEEAFNRYKAEMDSRFPAAASPAVDPAPARPAAPAVDAARRDAVAAVERPNTGNAADDDYTYGFRLWDAKFYPEAQAQLKATLDKYGSSGVASRTANLLGRAYLDDGKPALASVAFYENYQKRPNGDRAAESLAYLGEALIQLKKPADACKVYSELEQVYAGKLTGAQRSMMEKGRVRAKCGA